MFFLIMYSITVTYDIVVSLKKVECLMNNRVSKMRSLTERIFNIKKIYIAK